MLTCSCTQSPVIWHARPTSEFIATERGIKVVVYAGNLNNSAMNTEGGQTCLSQFSEIHASADYSGFASCSRPAHRLGNSPSLRSHCSLLTSYSRSAASAMALVWSPVGPQPRRLGNCLVEAAIFARFTSTDVMFYVALIRLVF